jgi:hypothetical protein
MTTHYRNLTVMAMSVRLHVQVWSTRPPPIISRHWWLRRLAMHQQVVRCVCVCVCVRVFNQK